MERRDRAENLESPSISIEERAHRIVMRMGEELSSFLDFDGTYSIEELSTLLSKSNDEGHDLDQIEELIISFTSLEAEMCSFFPNFSKTTKDPEDSFNIMNFIDPTTIDLKDLIKMQELIENHILRMNELNSKLGTYLTIDPHGIFEGMMSLRCLTVRKIYGEKYANEFYNAALENYDASEMSYAFQVLERYGQNFGPEYAPAVSKQQHLLRYGARPGKEKGENFEKRWENINYNQNNRLLSTDSKIIQRLLLNSICRPFVSKQLLLELPLIYLKQKSTAVPLDKALDDNLEEMAEQIYLSFLALFFVCYEEQLTEGLIGDLNHLLHVVPAAAYIANPNKDFNIETYNKLSISVFKKIGQHLGPVVEEYCVSGEPTVNTVDLDVIDREANVAALLSMPFVPSYKLLDFLEKSLERSSGYFEVFLFRTTLPILCAMNPESLPRLKPILEQSIMLADSPLELIMIWNPLATADNGGEKVLRMLKPAMISRLKTFDDYLNSFLEVLVIDKKNYARAGLPRITNSTLAEFFINDSSLYEKLFEILENPDYKTFYNACIVASDLIQNPEVSKIFTPALIEKCFNSPEAFDNPHILAAFDNICERLPDKERKLFCRSIAEQDGMDLADTEKLRGLIQYGNEVPNIIDARRAKKNAVQKRKAELQEEEKMMFGALEVLQKFPGELLEGGHDLSALSDFIVKNRSIQMGDGEFRVKTEYCANSALAAVFPEAIIKRKKGMDAYPQSLRSIVKFETKDGLPLYCKLDDNGALLIRVLKNGQETKLISKSNCENEGISEKIFNELNYLALKVLEYLYVREKIVNGDSLKKDSEEKPKGEKDKSCQTDSVEHLPLINERTTDQTMHIDLSERHKKSEETKKKAKTSRIKLNVKLAKQLFSDFYNGIPLSEDYPDEIENLVVYRREQMVGKRGKTTHRIEFVKCDPADVYAELHDGSLNLDDVFIRVGRSFSKALPYIKHTRRNLHTVTQSGASDYAKTRHKNFISDGGEELKMGAFDGYLSFRVDDTDFNESLALQVQDPELISGIIASRVKEVREWERDERESLRAELVDRDETDLLKYVDEISVLEDCVREQIAHINEIWREVPARVQEKQYRVEDEDSQNGYRVVSKFDLPQGGFTFNQTFNQGRFKSLSEIL